MINIKNRLDNCYYNYITEVKEELEKSKKLVSVIDSIEYRTKKNGQPYAKTEDNIITSVNCRVRYDRGFKWLDIHGADWTEMYKSHYVAVFDLKKPLDELKKSISAYRKELVKDIEKDEKLINLTFEEFVKEGLKG